MMFKLKIGNDKTSGMQNKIKIICSGWNKIILKLSFKDFKKVEMK
jgi:hypothetical protein